MKDYYVLREELAGELRGVPGVLGVGVGKGEISPVLVVLVDFSTFKSQIDRTYKGVEVDVRGFNRAISHLNVWRSTSG